MLGLFSIFTSYQLILLALAVAPAIYLMSYIYRTDKLDKEPSSLLFKLTVLGAITGPLAAILETILSRILLSSAMSYTQYYRIYAFLVIAVVEEGLKLLFLYLGSWKNRNFDYQFDGIVYAVYVSLGFAILENVLYVIRGGAGVAIMRAVLSIPGHMCFAIFMGIFYGRARAAANRGQRDETRRQLCLALLTATLIHGFYDYYIMTSQYLLFGGVVALIYITIIKIVRSEAKQDHRI